MSNKKFDWDMILRDSAEIIAASITASEDDIPKISQLYQKIKEKYESEGKTVPKPNTYRQFMHKNLNMGRSKICVQNVLYQLVGAYDKMSLSMLAKNVIVASDSISSNNCWLFIKLRTVLHSDYIQETNMKKSKLMYYLSHGLKKKYSDEILFISFDADTIAIMCTNTKTKKKLVSYFQKHGISAETISKEN